MKRQYKTLRQVILCGALGITLSACGQTEVPVLILPPAELAQCADDPVLADIPRFDWEAMRKRALASNIPSVAVDTLIAEAKETVRIRGQITLNGVILPLRTSGGDCRAKVKGLATWRDEAG